MESPRPMTKQEVINHLQARLEAAKQMAEDCKQAKAYKEAHFHQGQAEELEWVLTLITCRTPNF